MTSKKLHDFHGMNYTAEHYGNRGVSDTIFATEMSNELEEEYSVAQVRAYRQTLVIPNNKPRAESAVTKLEEAKKHLRWCLHELERVEYDFTQSFEVANHYDDIKELLK